MSEGTFTLTYDGPALADHTIDAADLAAALVGMSQYLKAASRVLNGDRFEVSVRAKALDDGCFQITLQIAGDFLDKLSDLLAGKQATAVANVIVFGTLAIGAVSAIAGRRVRRQRPSAPDFVILELEDGTDLEFQESTVRIALDPNARAALERVVADPLERDGVDEVRVAGAGEAVTVTQADVDAFRGAVAPEDELLRVTSRMVFAVVAPSFREGNKWRLSSGRGPPFPVTIADQDFIARVQRSEEAFAKGDFLICDVETTSRQSGGRLVTDYAIVRVVEHKRAEPQAELI
jgi:hypothetical protein